MGHEHHPHEHHHGRNLAFAFWLNLSFTLVEIVGSVLTNSVAILSDAVHDLGDSLSLGLAWYFERLAGREVNRAYTYGFRRFSVLGALINVVVLIVGGILVVFRAIPKLIHPEEVEAGGMVLLALLGIAVNGLAVWRMRNPSSVNEKVVSLHLLEDVLGWVAVLIGGVIMYFVDAPWIDPLLSLGIAAYIFFNALRNLSAILGIFLQKVPKGFDVEEVRNQLREVRGVEDAHDIHLWTMDGKFVVMTAHVAVAPTTTMGEIERMKKEIRELTHGMGIQHSTTEFEVPGSPCAHEDH